MRVGVDIDGTVAQWPELAAKLVNYNNPEISEIEVWRFFERREPEFIEPIIEKLVKDMDVYRILRPYDRAAEVLKRLDRRGLEIYYISARPRIVWTVTQNWLLRNNFPRWSNSFLGCDNKAIVADSLGLSYFIEDQPGHLDQLVKSGYKVLAPQRVWNHLAGVPQFELADDTFIFQHWSQVYQYFKSEGLWKDNGKNSRLARVVTPN